MDLHLSLLQIYAIFLKNPKLVRQCSIHKCRSASVSCKCSVRNSGFGSVVAVDPMRAGAADVSFVAPYIPSAIDALGLAGWDDHTDKETADIRMFGPLTKRAAVFLYRLSKLPK